MTEPCAVAIAAFVASAVALSPVTADELRDPVHPSSAGVAANPPVSNVAGCTALPAAGPVVAANLVVRNTNRPDVGPYTVTLPGFATNADPSTDRYAPFVIEAHAGDTLRIDLNNQLSQSASENIINLHTHGLIVSPRPSQPCAPAGDYIFNDIGPGSVERYRIDIPSSVNGVFGSGQQPYPAGLYWFHSHEHGSAKDQIYAGQAGLLSIAAPAGAPNPNPANVRSRYLALRDIQLSVPHGKTPDLPAATGQQAVWINGGNIDTQACRSGSNPGTQMLGGSNFGYCGHVGIADSNGKITDKTHDTVWLFTVNGQYEPTITVAPGSSEFWRIANLSATASYVLTLADSSGALQNMQLLTLDGVVASSGANDGKLQAGLILQRILLMPASRAEIMVTNIASHGTDVSLTLRSEGIETGGVQAASVNRTSYQGDPWPAVSLAHVIMQGSSQAVLSSVTATVQPINLPPAVSISGVIPPNCVTLPGPAFRRRITFAQTDSDFRLGSEVVDATGKPADGNNPAAPHTIAPGPFNHVPQPESVKHLCAPVGSVEVWELINTTNELHNFHIHQTKFRLTRAGDPGAPPGFTTAMVMQDPARVVINQIPEFANAESTGGDVWHDTMPVPPADAKGNPGEVFVTIPFTDPVQVGTFVFHCHILEHEDGGMMATFQVYDPRSSASARPIVRSAATTNTPFCGHAPPGFEMTTADSSNGASPASRIAQSVRSIARRLTETATLIRDWLPTPNASIRVH